MKRQWRKPAESDHFSKGKFHNLIPTAMLAKDKSFGSVLMDRFKRPDTAFPSTVLPSLKTDLKQFSPDTPAVIWFGHSSYLLIYNGVRILVDPVFSGHASPLPGMIKAFRGADVYMPADFPSIDYLIITHNHYDHLDKKTIAQLLPKVRRVYTSLGVGKYLPLHASDIPVTEMDWWETQQLQEGISLTATPARHFSGRGLVQNESLWSSFVLQFFDHRLYLGGDSGYGPHFKKIGDMFGPFDLALLECGQYNLSWHDIHLLPEETAQAAVDLQTRVLMPVHWAKFALANHPWNEPPGRLLLKSKELNVKVTTPMIGEPVIVGKEYPETRWWE
ncbi:MAG: MBL fold metallo-hydrolase [Citrobacter freundii]|nr:MAG: MBL fold metallo-hydrolase [Citrobacter freundii]